MSDINKTIGIDADTSQATGQIDKLDKKINSLDTGTTKVTKSTKQFSEANNNSVQSVTKNGGAIGVLSNALGSNVTLFKDATEAIELTGVSLKGLKGAIIATGIGILVVVMGELVANWDKWVSIIDGSAEAMANLNKQIKTQKQFATELAMRNAEDITNREEQIRLMAAQGASAEALAVKEDELSLVRERLARNTLEGFTADQNLFTIRENLQKQMNGLNKESDKYEKLQEQYIANEQQIIQLTKDKAKAMNDPKVRQATQETAKRNQAIADSLKAQAEATKKAEEATRANIATLERYKTLIENINGQVRKFSDMDLSSNFLQMRNLTDAYFSNQKALSGLIELKDKLSGASKKEAEEAIATANRNNDSINKEIALNKEKNESAQLYKNIMLATQINVNKLQEGQIAYTEQDLHNQFEKMKGEFDYRGSLQRTIQVLTLKNNIASLAIQQETEQFENRKKSVENNLKSYIEENAKMVEFANARDTAEVERTDKQKELLASITTKQKEQLDIQLHDYYLYKDQITDLDLSINDNKFELLASNSALELEINQATFDTQEEMKAKTMDAMLELDQMYIDASVNAHQNLYGLLGVLQDESLIKSKGIRTALLVLEKGMAIADVWINEAKSSAAATAAANAVPPVIGVSPNPMYAVAQALAVKAKVGNKISASIATATILAQTLASFNKGGSGSGSGGGGAAMAAPQAQFNMVGNSGTNQLAETIGNQQNRPVNAYVVAGEVSTAQELERNRINQSTFL